MTDIVAVAFFTRNTGTPATGLALADIDLYLTAINRASGVRDVIWNGTQNPTAEVTNFGAYQRIYEDADLDNYVYLFRATYTGAVSLDVDNVTGAIPSIDPWGFDERTLSQPGASVITAVSGSLVTVYRSSDWSRTLTGLGDISSRAKLYFSVKSRLADTDDAALVRIEETAGLLRINSTEAETSGNGSITVTDGANGDITIALKAVEAQKLSAKTGLYYDVKEILVSGGVNLLTRNRLIIEGIVTDAVT